MDSYDLNIVRLWEPSLGTVFWSAPLRLSLNMDDQQQQRRGCDDWMVVWLFWWWFPSVWISSLSKFWLTSVVFRSTWMVMFPWFQRSGRSSIWTGQKPTSTSVLFHESHCFLSHWPPPSAMAEQKVSRLWAYFLALSESSALSAIRAAVITLFLRRKRIWLNLMG